jgi:hypothetical protein
MSGSSPSFEKVLAMAIESRLFDVHTALPGVVEAYDPGTETVTVRPALKRKYEDGSVVELPLIMNVPVTFPRGGKASITFPIKKGDSGLLIFSERSLDVWKAKGGVVDPADPRKFNMTDAFFVPGGYPKGKPSGRATADKFRITHGTSEIEMGEAAKFKIGKVGGDELLDLMSQLLQELLDAKTNTAIGPMPLWANTITKLTQIKSKLDALKG